MTKRNVSAVLWFFAVWTAGSMLSVYAGVPSLLGPAVGVLVAALVWWDPTGRVWTRARVTPQMRRRLADLQRVPDVAIEADLRHEVDPAQG